MPEYSQKKIKNMIKQNLFSVVSHTGDAIGLSISRHDVILLKIVPPKSCKFSDSTVNLSLFIILEVVKISIRVRLCSQCFDNYLNGCLL